MKDKDFKDNQKVFSFINSDSCNEYEDLLDFLKSSILPMRERWAFYFLGKKNWIDSVRINKMGQDRENNYGGYIYGHIYHWSWILLEEKEEKEWIKIDLEEKGIEVTEEVLHKTFITQGWERVDECIQSDQEGEQDRIDRLHYNDRDLTLHEEQPEFYCESCQSSPCMCSDPGDPY